MVTLIKQSENKEVIYYITRVGDGPWKLVSEVQTNFGGPAINYVCEGTKEYCENTKRYCEAQIERLNDLK